MDNPAHDRPVRAHVAVSQSLPKAAGAVQLVSGRWTLAVLAVLTPGGRRYQDLHDVLVGISYEMLGEMVRRAERDGLIVRHLDGVRIGTSTLYELTPAPKAVEHRAGRSRPAP